MSKVNEFMKSFKKGIKGEPLNLKERKPRKKKLNIPKDYDKYGL